MRRQRTRIARHISAAIEPLPAIEAPKASIDVSDGYLFMWQTAGTDGAESWLADYQDAVNA